MGLISHNLWYRAIGVSGASCSGASSLAVCTLVAAMKTERPLAPARAWGALRHRVEDVPRPLLYGAAVVFLLALLVGMAVLQLSLLSVRAANSPYQAVGPAETRPDSRVAQLDTTPVFPGAGDIGSVSSDGDEYTARVLDAIFAGNPPGGIFTTGGNVNEGPVNLADFMAYFDPTWGRHKALIRPTAGNHDYLDTAGVGQGFFDYFNGIGNFTGPAGDRDKGYYSYDLGAWHIVVLNSNCSKVGGCGVGSPQEKWLRADLAAHPTVCTAAMWHQPRFSSGRTGSNSAVQALWQAVGWQNAIRIWTVDGMRHMDQP